MNSLSHKDTDTCPDCNGKGEFLKDNWRELIPEEDLVNKDNPVTEEEAYGYEDLVGEKCENCNGTGVVNVSGYFDVSCEEKRRLRREL